MYDSYQTLIDITFLFYAKYCESCQSSLRLNIVALRMTPNNQGLYNISPMMRIFLRLILMHLEFLLDTAVQ